MSVALIESEIQRFLGTKDAEVLCISGKWGVGKTYAWNTFLKSANSTGKIAIRRYAYVSLFGRNSIEDIRSAIIENTVVLNGVEQKPNIETFTASLESHARKFSSFLKSTPKIKDYVSFGERVLFATMEPQIVCIDDLERCGQDLSVHDVLGLVSELKEQKLCKVVVLLNEEKLDALVRQKYDDHLEKIADVSVRFEPSSHEAASIGLSGDISGRDSLARMCQVLGITNIRIIKRIERNARRIGVILHGYDSRIIHQAVSSSTLFTNSRFQPNQAPTLDFLRRFNRFTGIVKPDDNEYARWRDTLADYDYSATDEFDLVVMAAVERGFFDEAELRAAADAMSTRLNLQDQGESVRAAWDLYHSSFDDDEEEVLAAIQSAFKANVDAITPLNANGTIRLLREVGRGPSADELADYYVRHRNEPREFWDLNEYAFQGDVTDPFLVDAFARKLASFDPPTLDAGEILVRISRQSGWNPADVTYLAGLSRDDFVTLFKRLRGDDLRRAVRESLRFANRGAIGSPEAGIAIRADEALDIIAAESPINARRVAQRRAEAAGR